ncbi:hypothetical protein DSECCO2_645450 [anaerobic digester metagenome]
MRDCKSRAKPAIRLRNSGLEYVVVDVSGLYELVELISTAGVEELCPSDIHPLVFTAKRSNVAPLNTKLNPIGRPIPVAVELPVGSDGST